MARTEATDGSGSGGKASLRAKPPYNLKSRIVSQLRRLFLWHPGLKEVRDRTRITRGLYRCEGCGAATHSKQMRCDHVEPVVDVTGFVDWNTYIARMFDVIPDGLQHLCKPCHDAKTAHERDERTKHRREQKILGGAA